MGPLKMSQDSLVKDKRCLQALVSVDNNRRLVSLVGKVPVYHAGGSGSIPGRTNTLGLKIIEEKVLSLL